LAMQGLFGLLAFALALPFLSAASGADHVDHKGHKHHHHHGHKHHKQNNATQATVVMKPVAGADAVVKLAVQAGAQSETNIVERMKTLELKLAEKVKVQNMATAKGHLLVNGPLPTDFNERFSQAVGQATGTPTSKVKVTDTTSLEDNPGIVEVAFEAPPKVVKTVENDAANPDSTLAKGNMRTFLVAREAPSGATNFVAKKSHSAAESRSEVAHEQVVHEPESAHEREATPVEEKGIDIDTAMPYGDLEPFGREDTAQELTESSVKESDSMVDQLERAEVAEEKRAVFRALTRLRGAAITSFDGVARSQTGNIDEYNKIHKWRKTHPLHHLADEESDVTKWAFPDNADF